MRLPLAAPPPPSTQRAARLFVPLFALTVLIGTAGCPPTVSDPCESDADCPEGRCRFGACRPVCEEDLDCGARQICSDGICVPPPECNADVDCARGFTCNAGLCRCTGDDACALNQSCTQGRCQTRPRCTTTEDCPPPQRCEVTQGLCLRPCQSSVDCGPGLDPQVALALYQCTQGTCARRCLGDATCGTGLVCQDGLCEAAQCESFGDCPSGRYCTSALFGRCEAYTVCDPSSDAPAQCPANHDCRPFGPADCPPGFPCETTAICRELPLCFVDDDCQAALPGQLGAASFCRDNHCQPSTRCTEDADCPDFTSGDPAACVGGVCVPGGCRGHADCPAPLACVAGACRAPPVPGDVARLHVTPRHLHLTVGGTSRLQVIATELDGRTFPLGSAAFEVLDPSGTPSAAASVAADGTVTASDAGRVRIRVTLPGAAVTPAEATVDIHPPPPQSGLRVVVVDSATRAPLAGVAVLGCPSLQPDGDCSAPVEVATDAMGEARFPTLLPESGSASLSIASPELRSDGLPRYERVTLLGPMHADALIALEENPVQSAAGFNAIVSFNQVRSSGNYWFGFAAAAVGDPSDADLALLLGEPFGISVPGLPQRVPVPGAFVLSTSPGLGIENKVKDRSLSFAQPGRRATVAFAGRTTSAQVTHVRSADLLAYTGALDYAVEPFRTFAHLPLVPDLTDIDGDGLCEDPQRCPLGTEEVPDYTGFTPLSFTPRFEQTRRTEVLVPGLPRGFDTVVVAAVAIEEESGLLPLGFTSRTGGGGAVGSVLLRSGPERGGAEAGVPGVWVMAVQAAASSGSVSGRVHRAEDGRLGTQVAIGPFVPLAEGSAWLPGERTFSPGQPSWSEAHTSGASLARVELLGAENRHRIWFEAQASQTRVVLPASPQVGGLDPASEPTPILKVTLMDVPAPVPPGGLKEPGAGVTAYSRWVGP